MQKDLKFKQISTCRKGDWVVVYGLSEDGDVYEWHSLKKQWIKLIDNDND